MRTIYKVLAGVGAAAVAGYAGYYIQENRNERPRYRRVERDGAIEVRAYPALLTAATLTTGERERSLRAGFRSLADYIFAKSRGGGPIAMTAPVFQSGEGTDNWRTRFVMPRALGRDRLPETPGGVEIEEVPARRVAAIRFNGGQDSTMLATKEAELRRWMAGRGYRAEGGVEYAFYNSPMIAPPLRRNEVLIPLANG